MKGTGYRERFISVDVETAGPDPGRYSLLSIGACDVEQPDRSFYVELKPISEDFVPSALEVSGLRMESLVGSGIPPKAAMVSFEEWVLAVAPKPERAIFVAFNAPFDWMFVNAYFYRFLGRNPFGHSALDLKALYMGLTGAPWSETAMPFVAARYLNGRQLRHHALGDARDQAELFSAMLEEARMHGWEWV